jgi:LL-diaminopimelate aminotransferase
LCRCTTPPTPNWPLTAIKPPSFLELPGAKDIAIEFHSLSKTYNMTGWRLGMVVGNREVLGALGKIKSNIDSGAFNAIQMAGIAALDSDQSCVAENCAVLPGAPGPPGGRPQEVGL